MSRLNIASKPPKFASTLGAAQIPNPPRVKLEKALQHLENTSNQTFAVRRDELENARGAVVGARAYVDVNKLGATHLMKIDEILDDIQWLADIAKAEASPYPENPESIENWYPRLARAKSRLNTEIGTYFLTIPAPTSDSGSSGGVKMTENVGIYTAIPGTAQFPEKVKVIVQPGDVVERVKGQDAKAAPSTTEWQSLLPKHSEAAYDKFEPDAQKVCGSLSPKLLAYYKSNGVDCLGLSGDLLAGVSKCSEYDYAYDPNQKSGDGCFWYGPTVEADIVKTDGKDPVPDAPPAPPAVEKSSPWPWVVAGIAAVGITAWYMSRKKD